MSAPARSILIFGVYIAVLGLLLAAAPSLVIRPFGLPVPREPWIRVLGLVVAVLGLYYVQAGREEVTAFFRWTIWGRGLILVGFCLLALLGLVPPVMIVFGVVDAAGAAWTASALRTRRRTTR